MGNFYVYAHYRPMGEIFYIGKGKGRRAWGQSISTRNHHWRNIVRKNGGFRVEILHENLDELLAIMLECSYIHCYGRADLGEGPLVNMTNGGEGTSGRFISEQTREKLKRAATGKLHSEKTKRKMSEALTGTPRSEETLRKIRETRENRRKNSINMGVG